MAVNLLTKMRAHFGAIIVGNPPVDGGADPNAGVAITAASRGGAVTAISSAASAVVTFTNAHGLNIGQLVTVTSPTTVTGGTNPFPGTFVITAVNIASKTITLGGCVTTGLTISGFTNSVTLVSPPRSNGTVPTAMSGTTTVTVTAPGNWSPGQQVFIVGVGTMTNVNGLQTVVTGGNGTFTFVPATAAAGSAVLTNASILDYPFTNTGVVPNGPAPKVIKGIYTFENISLTPGTLLTNTSVTLTVTLPGVNQGDIVVPQQTYAAAAVGGAQAGLQVTANVTGPNTVTVVVTNVTAGTLTTPVPVVNFLWIRLI